jgi:hypothetical protein
LFIRAHACALACVYTRALTQKDLKCRNLYRQRESDYSSERRQFHLSSFVRRVYTRNCFVTRLARVCLLRCTAVTFICICIHICMHICIHIGIRMHMSIYMGTHTDSLLYTGTQVCSHAYVFKCMQQSCFVSVSLVHSFSFSFFASLLPIFILCCYC